MAVLIPGKILYLCTPHTASRSTSAALSEIDGSVLIDYHHITVPEIKDGKFRKVRIRAHGKHDVLFHYSEKRPFFLHVEMYTEKEHVVTTMRNPYDLVITWWIMYRDKAGFRTLADFVNEYGGMDLDAWARDATRILRYEHLSEDLNKLLEECEMEPVELPHVNKSSGKREWQDYYDRESLDAVNKRFAHWFEKYGYERL